MNWFQFEVSTFLWVFIVLNIVNVIIQTIKSIATITCGKVSASVINAVAYGLYTIVVVYMSADGLGLFWKALIIGIANLVGVYVVKYAEEKSRKDKLWKVEATLQAATARDCVEQLRQQGVSCNYVEAGKFVIVNCYCGTQLESAVVKIVLGNFGAKYFVSESKTL